MFCLSSPVYFETMQVPPQRVTVRGLTPEVGPMLPDDITLDSKRCPKCSETKSRAAFSRDRSRLDGLSCYCKACKAAHWDQNRERFLAQQAEWRANHPERVVAWQAAYYAQHIEYYAARALVYRENNRERIAAQKAVYRAGHLSLHAAHQRNRRARKLGAGGSHTAEQLTDLRQEQQDLCVYCWGPLGESPHVDHMIPLARGGSDSIDNLVWACAPCNLKKHAKTAEEFLKLSLMYRGSL